MLGFAKQKVEEKLVETLLELAKTDGFFKMKDIKDAMTEKFDEKQDWLDMCWVGRALKRLGFIEKRRVGTVREYRLSPEKLQDLAERFSIQTSRSVLSNTLSHQTPQTTQIDRSKSH